MAPRNVTADDVDDFSKGMLAGRKDDAGRLVPEADLALHIGPRPILAGVGRAFR